MWNLLTHKHCITSLGKRKCIDILKCSNNIIIWDNKKQNPKHQSADCVKERQRTPVFSNKPKCCSKRASYCSSLNPKITGTLRACFLSSVVSGLPLYPAVFRLGPSLMSLLEEQLLHHSFTAQLCSRQLIACPWKLRNIDHRNGTRSSGNERGHRLRLTVFCVLPMAANRRWSASETQFSPLAQRRQTLSSVGCVSLLCFSSTRKR